MFKLAAARAPLDTDNLLACGATHSRLEGALRRINIYRMAGALIEQLIAGYSSALTSITLDLDHTDDTTHAQLAERLPCWPLLDPARLAHETVPPTPINNPFTLRPTSGGWGTIG